MKKKAFFVSATGQNVGKTTICLGLISALQKKISKVGFIKPVGQRHQQIANGSHVDKDVVLFKEHFHLKSDYSDMSPLLLPSGFTRDYLDGKYEDSHLRDNIRLAFQKIVSSHDLTIVEGTGHVGVGSIVNLNNAQVAKELELEAVIITSGGIGSAFDELALNRLMFQAHGVKVIGVILNRVLDAKRNMVVEYMQKALTRWKIPLLGVIPFSTFLSTPSMQDFEVLFKTELFSGKEFLFRHFERIRLVATSEEKFKEKVLSNELIITPASRKDVISVVSRKAIQATAAGNSLKSGFILTGHEPPTEEVIKIIQSSQLPALYCPVSNFEAMRKISTYTGKIQNEDTHKVNQAISLVEQHVDIEALCQQIL